MNTFVIQKNDEEFNSIQAGVVVVLQVPLVLYYHVDKNL